MTDPIADMVNRIKNAQNASNETVVFPFSRIKHEIALILQKEGFIKGIEKKGRKDKKIIKIDLKYPPAISGVKRVSRPGQRIYASAGEIRPVKEGRGIAIISTSHGIMSDKETRRNRLGGEVMCKIW